MQQPLPPQGYQQEEYNQPMSYTPEGSISNIVGQIDPSTIVDNLNHSLKGEFYDKEQGKWLLNPSGKPLVNDACRGFVISYVTGILNNNSVMGTISQAQLGFIMETVIEELGKEFVCNLERFGFVPAGPGYKKGVYMNQGNPNSSRMSSVCGIIFRSVFSCYTRSLNGMESRKLFSSLNMTDGLNFNPQQEKGAGWMGRMFGR